MRVIIAADSALLRAGLARLLEDAGMQVVATAGDCAELTRKARAHHPDVAVVSLDDTPCRIDELPVLMLAQGVDHERALALLDNSPAGVGYLLEHRVPDVERFVSAVRQVANGGSVLDPAVLAEVLDRRTSRDGLSPREREVLALMAEGRSNRAIAATAYLSERAVERHVTAIFDKLRLPQTPRTHRRVLAVLSHLQLTAAAPPRPIAAP
jgi:DNA-binding NarL/FixJ family response regulator